MNTLSRTPNLDRVTSVGNEANRPIVITHTTTPAELDRPFEIYNELDDLIFAIDSGDLGSAGYASPPNGLILQPFGAEGMTGSANRVTFFNLNGGFGTGFTEVQSGRTRLVQALMRFKPDIQKTGYDGEEARAGNFSMIWDSTNTCDEATGIVNNMFSNSSGGATGTVDIFTCNKSKVGFNTVGGSAHINTATGFLFEAPKNVVNSNTIGTLIGVDIEDLTAANITNSIAFRTAGESKLQVGTSEKSDGWQTFPMDNVQLTNNTPTSVQSLTLEEDYTYYIKSVVVGRSAADNAVYEIVSAAHRDTAGAAVLDATTTTVVHESTAAMTAVHVANGNDIEVQITSMATPTKMQWKVTTHVQNIEGP